MLANMISFPLRNKMWQFSNSLFGNFSHGVGFNNGQRNNSEALRVNLSPAISFRPENLEFEFRPRYGLQYTHNSVTTNSSTKPTVHNYGGSFSAYYRTPIDVILSSDVTFTATKGYSEGYDTTKTNGCGTPQYPTKHSATSRSHLLSRLTTYSDSRATLAA